MKVIGYAMGAGGCVQGAEQAPYFLKENLKMDLDWDAILESDAAFTNHLDSIANLNQKLAQKVFSFAQENQFFLVFGGDHSSAIGTWSGLAEGKRSEGDVGLMWIDAHMDGHTFETTESGNIHGMPTAALLGYGSPLLTHILSKHPKIKPSNLAIIGCRSFEKSEAKFLSSLGVKVFFMEEVRKRGYLNILKEGISMISKNTVGFGVSLDLDVLDPLWVKGIGTPVPGGLSVSESIEGVDYIAEQQSLLGFEIAEYNPLIDKNLETFKILQSMVAILARGGCSKGQDCDDSI